MFNINLGSGLAAHMLEHAYNKSFSILRAETDTLREEVFRLRYKVFCVENPFEDKASFPDQMEKDAYDKRASHILLRENETGQAIGTIRLILPNHDNPDQSFPMQAVCNHSLMQSHDSVQTFCEVSRLCITREFRTRRARSKEAIGMPLKDYLKSPSINKALTQHLIPYAPLGLFKEAFSWALDHKSVNCVAVMEPHLIKSLRKIGFRCAHLGETVEFHGIRQPIIFNIKQMYDRLMLDHSFMNNFMTEHGTLHHKALAVSEELWENAMMAHSLNTNTAPAYKHPHSVPVTANTALVDTPDQIFASVA